MDTRGTPFCALITGAAKRIGATIAQELHAQGMDILLHCHRSERLARELARQCNARRADSVFVLRADLNDLSSLDPLLEQAFSIRPRIDALIHNASLFHPTPLPDCSHEDWERILRVNLSAPFFLSQRFAAQEPRPAHIIHIADIHGQRPLAGHVPYSVSKAGLIMLTKALAQELAPATPRQRHRARCDQLAGRGTGHGTGRGNPAADPIRQNRGIRGHRPRRALSAPGRVLCHRRSAGGRWRPLHGAMTGRNRACVHRVMPLPNP